MNLFFSRCIEKSIFNSTYLKFSCSKKCPSCLKFCTFYVILTLKEKGERRIKMKIWQVKMGYLTFAELNNFVGKKNEDKRCMLLEKKDLNTVHHSFNKEPWVASYSYQKLLKTMLPILIHSGSSMQNYAHSDSSIFCKLDYANIQHFHSKHTHRKKICLIFCN